MPKFSKRSLEKLATCHPDIQRLFNVVIQHRDCVVVYGFRGQEEQTEIFESGNSLLTWPKSMHNKTPSLAIDVVPYFEEEPHVRWHDEDAFVEFGNFVLGVAAAIEIEIKWGGHWKRFRDMAHFELLIDQAAPQKC